MPNNDAKKQELLELYKRREAMINLQAPDRLVEQQYEEKFIPQMVKGAYDNMPFLKGIIERRQAGREEPLTDLRGVPIDQLQEEFPDPTTDIAKAGRSTGEAVGRVGGTLPFMAAAAPLGAVPVVGGPLAGAVGLGSGEAARSYVKGESTPEIARSAKEGAKFGGLYGLATGVGATVIPKVVLGSERIGSAIGAGFLGAATAPEGERLKSALSLAGIAAILPAGRMTSKNYTGAKVKQIRKQGNKYKHKEYANYDKAIKTLGKGKGRIAGEPVVENIERMLVEKGIIDANGVRTGRPLSTSESRLAKSYDRILREYVKNNGQISTDGLVNEYQSLRGKVPRKPTSQSLENQKVASEFFNGAKDLIDSKTMTAANARYTEFKQNQALIDKHFDLYPKSPEMTGKGESFLREMGGSAEADAVAKTINKELGVSLKGAEALTFLSRLGENPMIRHLITGVAAGGGAVLGGKLLQD